MRKQNPNFSRNVFSGSIPDSIGDLKVLDNLNLSYNDLYGTIPTSIAGAFIFEVRELFL